MHPFLQPVWLALDLLCGPVPLCAADYDVIVSGGTSSGVIATMQAKKMGKSVTLVCLDKDLGGVSSGGKE
jgi:hypothetical protein